MKNQANSHFELELDLPSERLRDLPARLVGFAARYERLRRDLRLLMDAEGLSRWSRKHYHGKLLPVVQLALERYPLAIFHGDVGTGKTETAEAAADALTRELNKEAKLFKLSTRVRGTGAVGEMSTDINEAFETVIAEAGKTRHVFLIVDEADSLAASRVTGNGHHEDKVGVNTLIQKFDEVRRLRGRVFVFLCTNRYDSLDPAIVRRAGRVERFERPDDEERHALFEMDCSGLGLSANCLKELVALTGPDEAAGRPGFTFSDLRTRLLPEALALAYPDRALDGQDLLAAVRAMQPSPAWFSTVPA